MRTFVATSLMKSLNKNKHSQELGMKFNKIFNQFQSLEKDEIFNTFRIIKLRSEKIDEPIYELAIGTRSRLFFVISSDDEEDEYIIFIDLVESISNYNFKKLHF